MADFSPSNEQHPLLPSGYWTGFYVYSHSQQRHEMLLMLDFHEGIISGEGQDDVGAFTFDGKYNLDAMTCRFLKHYATHTIDYRGDIDENGIWGKWYYVHADSMGMTREEFTKLAAEMPNIFSGGFHIWPRSREFSAYEMEVRKLKEEAVVKLVQ